MDFLLRKDFYIAQITDDYYKGGVNHKGGNLENTQFCFGYRVP